MNSVDRPALPSRRQGRRRDRHGRGLRGPLLPPVLPGARTRTQRFDDVVVDVVELLEDRLGTALAGVEFAVEDVPPSDPSPWERGEISLARFFPGESRSGLSDRIVVYRRPIGTRAVDEDDLADLVREVLVEQVAQLLGRDPEDIDPGHGR